MIEEWKDDGMRGHHYQRVCTPFKGARDGDGGGRVKWPDQSPYAVSHMLTCYMEVGSLASFRLRQTMSTMTRQHPDSRQRSGGEENFRGHPSSHPMLRSTRGFRCGSDCHESSSWLSAHVILWVTDRCTRPSFCTTWKDNKWHQKCSSSYKYWRLQDILFTPLEWKKRKFFDTQRPLGSLTHRDVTLVVSGYFKKNNKTHIYWNRKC